MAWLHDNEKISKISLVVLVKLTNVTDGRTPGELLVSRFDKITSVFSGIQLKLLSELARLYVAAFTAFFCIEH